MVIGQISVKLKVETCNHKLTDPSPTDEQSQKLKHTKIPMHTPCLYHVVNINKELNAIVPHPS